MANVENRAAEHGSIIIEDALFHGFSPSKPIVAIRILEDTVITALVATNMGGTEDYYDLAVLTATDKDILGNFVGITLTSGAVQGIFS